MAKMHKEELKEMLTYPLWIETVNQVYCSSWCESSICDGWRVSKSSALLLSPETKSCMNFHVEITSIRLANLVICDPYFVLMPWHLCNKMFRSKMFIDFYAIDKQIFISFINETQHRKDTNKMWKNEMAKQYYFGVWDNLASIFQQGNVFFEFLFGHVRSHTKGKS